MSNPVIEQPALFDDVDDSALLFRGEAGFEMLRKRYTADQVQEMEWKRNAIIMLLASDWPCEVIARQLHVNLRTVTALAKRNGEEVAGFTREFAGMLMRTGGRWLGLARTKEDSASFKDLAIGAGIVMQHARELSMMGEVAEEKVVKEDQDHAQAAAALRAMMAQPLELAGEVANGDGRTAPGDCSTDSASIGNVEFTEDLMEEKAVDAVGDADPTRTGQPERDGVRSESEGTGGGDRVGPDRPDGLTHLRDGGLSGKGPDE